MGKHQTLKGHTVPVDWEEVRFDLKKGRVAPIHWIRSSSLTSRLPWKGHHCITHPNFTLVASTGCGEMLTLPSLLSLCVCWLQGLGMIQVYWLLGLMSYVCTLCLFLLVGYPHIFLKVLVLFE